MNRLISKTIFLDFLYCPKNVWLKLHRPELLEKFTLSEFEKHIIEQGNKVESCARGLFPGGIEVASVGEDACNETLRLMATKIPMIFQSTFIVGGFIARNDMLSSNNETERWDLYEVKGTNSLKEDAPDYDHVDDVAFQVSVLNRAHIPISRYFLIHLNKEYIRSGDLNINSLFVIEDVTEKVLARLPEIEKQMEIAREYLMQDKEPVGGCECVYKGRRKHCTTFQYSNPHIPEYSVHDLARVSKKKLDLFVEREVYDLKDIPDDFDLTANQRNQVLTYLRQKPLINLQRIQEELGALKFPFYFFDYEAFGPAIPVFNGYGPYKRIPFQFSLHILKSPTEELIHVEYLHDELSDPSENVARLLQKHILPGGTVIAWHKSFEAVVNKEIAIRLPKYSSLFEQMNNSLYDLKDIFQNQHYVHHGFRGSTSLKKVLPTLAPELRYDELDIREGGQAADAWWKMVSPATPLEESKKIATDLKIYCGFDTYAMYAIWKHLQEMIL